MWGFHLILIYNINVVSLIKYLVIVFVINNNTGAHAQMWACLWACPILWWACHCLKWVCLQSSPFLTSTSGHDSHSVNEIWVARFYLNSMTWRRPAVFSSHLLIKTSVRDLLLEKEPRLSTALHRAFLSSVKMYFLPLIFHSFSLPLLFFCFFPGKAEVGLWMENVNEAFRLNAPGWGSVPCDPTPARRRKTPALDHTDTTMDFNRETTTQKQSNSTNRWVCMAATHKNSAGVELHIRRIMLAFKKPTKPTKSNSNNANTPACACLLGVLSRSAGNRRWSWIIWRDKDGPPADLPQCTSQPGVISKQ